MTTTRINHTGHNHPNTTAARTACRKTIRNAAPAPVMYPTAMVGNGVEVHRAVLANDGTLVAVECGAGMQRGRRRASTLHRGNDASLAVITCNRCAKVS